MTTNYLDVADGGRVLDELADSKPKPSICYRFCHSHAVAELVVVAADPHVLGAFFLNATVLHQLAKDGHLPEHLPAKLMTEAYFCVPHETTALLSTVGPVRSRGAPHRLSNVKALTSYQSRAPCR